MMRQPKIGASQSSPTLPTPAQGVRWTSPIVETPGIVVLGSWIYRLVRLVVLLPFHFPVMVTTTTTVAACWWYLGWVGLSLLACGVSVASLIWWRVCGRTPTGTA